MEDLIDSEIVADLTLHVEAISRHVPLRLLRPISVPNTTMMRRSHR